MYLIKPKICFLLSVLFSSPVFAQYNTGATLVFDFNEQQIKEKDSKVIPRHSGVVLTRDRFGNERSAVLMKGDAACYLSLSDSPLLKSSNMTISLWANLHRRNYIGKGDENNPLITTKNGPGEDFINAVTLVYNPNFDRVGAVSTKDSTNEVVAVDDAQFQFNTWHHYVVVCNNNYLALYADGVLKQKTKKNFETKFLASDSMVVGHSASKKNERMSIGAFDDIQIFRRSLTDSEIKALFEASNPNAFKNVLFQLLKIVTVIIVLIGIIVTLVIRNKRALEKQKEQLELFHRISELELKVIKTQMNPHFISNSLAAIQNLILQKEIDKASQYLAKFSHFLRQILEYSEKNYVTLDEELSIIKLNVELEQLRFKNNFSFRLQIENGIDSGEFLIPALITHPFIENAIWHGLLQLEHKIPQLKVNVFLKTDAAYISIEDNGVGRMGKEAATSRKSMGIKLALDKIENLNKLQNNTDLNLEITDLFDEKNKPAGTKIIIRLIPNTY